MREEQLINERAGIERFGVDKNGAIITEVSLDKVTEQFKPIVDDVLTTVVKDFSSELESVYLYGSIATGKAIEGKSDLDILIVLKEKASKELGAEISALENRLTEKYASMLRGVGLAVTNIDEVKSETEASGLMCFIKHLCVCIYGNDLARNVSAFKPTKEVANGFSSDFSDKLEAFKKKLATTTLSEDEMKTQSQAFAKRMIRTSFSLVIPRSQSWTTDLKKSTDTFSYYYPEKAKEIRVALQWSEEGSADVQEVTGFLDNFGEWLSAEFEREIKQ